MVTVLICSIVFAVVSQNFSGINRVLKQFLDRTVFKEQIYVFLSKFDEEYHQAEAFDADGLTRLESMRFEMDLNGDGDRDDSGETIQYRWNPQKRRIDRKSGNGSFQSMVEGVASFTWLSDSDREGCHQMALKGVFRSENQVFLFCRSKFLSGKQH